MGNSRIEVDFRNMLPSKKSAGQAGAKSPQEECQPLAIGVPTRV